MRIAASCRPALSSDLQEAINKSHVFPRRDLNLYDDTFTVSCKEIFMAPLHLIDLPRIVLGILFDKH